MNKPIYYLDEINLLECENLLAEFIKEATTSIFGIQKFVHLSYAVRINADIVDNQTPSCKLPFIKKINLN